MSRFISVLTVALLVLLSITKGMAQGVYKIMENISTSSNITYKKVDSIALKLDVYYPAEKLGQEPHWEKVSDEKKPVLINFHGGGWIGGDKIASFLALLPYLENNWCVVNVEYRLLQQTNLIGALNDCIDAINWVQDSGAYFKFDTDRIFVTGESAGGHLALLSGMMNASGMEKYQIHPRRGVVQGIINWYGVAEMKSAIQFWKDDGFTKMIMEKWEGDPDTYLEITSPIHFISSETTPSVITIHGDKDINVDMDEQSVLLHDALTKQGVKNKLVTIKGKKHGNFDAEELKSAFDAIWSFFEINK